RSRRNRSRCSKLVHGVAFLCGITIPSLAAQGEQRRFSYFNIEGDNSGDIGAAALCYLSWTLWHLGYIDQASAVAAPAMKHAEELSHPHTLVYTICHARGFMDLFRQHHEDIQSYTVLVGSLCTENRFSHWINCGRVLEGWAEACQGNVDQGIEVLRAGM